jgi:hypothetical protein
MNLFEVLGIVVWMLIAVLMVIGVNSNNENV